MNVTEDKTCYVCQEPVLIDDVPVFKNLPDVEGDEYSVRHMWHIAPNHDFVQGMVRYTTDVESAKEWAVKKLVDPYKAPEQKVLFKAMLDEVNRLLRKQEPEPPY